MNYNYTEEDYSEMYNNLPEGLKDLVLSGRLAIQVSAIGSRHGLTADQISDLEPAVEDVCLGLITKQELADNIKNSTGTDSRVANRIAAEVEIEILRPFEAELIISRQQKEDLDVKISDKKQTPKTGAIPQKEKTSISNKDASQSISDEPDVSTNPSALDSKVSNWYSKNSSDTTTKTQNNASSASANNFSWDNIGKKEEQKTFDGADSSTDEATVSSANIPNVVRENSAQTSFNDSSASKLENKLDILTENINKLISARFGAQDDEKKDSGLSLQMQELVKRLEKVEKDNEEKDRLIRSLKGGSPVQNIFPEIVSTSVPTKKDDVVQPVPQTTNSLENQIPIDKARKVDILKPNNPEVASSQNFSNNSQSESNPDSSVIKVDSVSTAIPIKKESPTSFVSTISENTLDSIVETRNTDGDSVLPTSTKKTLSLDDLLKVGDDKIKEVNPKKTTLVFPGINDEKRIDINNISQKDSIRQTLLDDIDFLRTNSPEASSNETNSVELVSENPEKVTENIPEAPNEEDQITNQSNPNTQNQTYASNPFKDELMPKTKEERMKALQDKIKSLNKGVSVGGKTNISAAGFDPYKL